MKKVASKLILIGILTLSFDKPKTPIPEPHQFIVKADFGTWRYCVDYMTKIQSIMVNTDLPSKQTKALNDTIEMIKTMIILQIQPQITAFNREDSIINANTKKDTTNKTNKNDKRRSN